MAYMENDLEMIRSKIYEIRGQKVMLDFDLAAMYGVETGQLKRAVRQNMERFEELKQDLEEIFTDYNDINEDTRIQLDAINTALADLQSDRKKASPRNRIGFRTDD